MPEPQPPILDYRTPATRRPRNVRRLVLAITLAITFTLVAVGLFLPLLNRKGGHTHIERCRPRLRQIGQALAIYANDYGTLPLRLDALLPGNADIYLPPDLFICPATNDTPATGPTTQALIAAFNTPGRCSYIYHGAALSNPPPSNAILAHDNPANHGPEGVNFLYGDGQVRWHSPAEARYLISELQSGHNPPRPTTRPGRP